MIALTVTKESRHKVLFSGFRVVQLQGEPTRETIRTAIMHWGVAMIQKNGNVAIGNSGIFDNPHNLRAQERVAFALFRLKMVSREFHDAAKRRFEERNRGIKVQQLKFDAEELGYTVREKFKVTRGRRGE